MKHNRFIGNILYFCLKHGHVTHRLVEMTAADGEKFDVKFCTKCDEEYQLYLERDE